jgi:hypothetical protein
VTDPKALSVLGNVYDNVSAPKEAKITFAVGGVDTTKDWTEQSDAFEELSPAAVFESRAAELYVDEGIRKSRKDSYNWHFVDIPLDAAAYDADRGRHNCSWRRAAISSRSSHPYRRYRS